jgi:acetyltransferase-like isoleucine patch superfamily enzyme
MTTSIIDFISCSILFSVLLALSILSTLCIAPYTTHFLSDYHVIVDFFIFLLSYGLLSGLLSKIISKVLPIQLGEFAMSDKNFTAWKIQSMICYTGKALLLPLTLISFRPLVLRILGAQVGKDIAMGGHVDYPFLTSIGDHVIIANGSQIASCTMINEKILIGKIKIGNYVTIGINAVVLPNVEIGDHAIVEIGSVVMPGSKIPPGERWRGNPARKWI